MDDLQLKVSSPDRYIVRRNGDLGLDPVVRRIRDLTMFGSSHERELSLPLPARVGRNKNMTELHLENQIKYSAQQATPGALADRRAPLR